MLEFRIVIGKIASKWLDARNFTIKFLEQFQEFNNYYIEYRGGKN